MIETHVHTLVHANLHTLRKQFNITTRNYWTLFTPFCLLFNCVICFCKECLYCECDSFSDCIVVYNFRLLYLYRQSLHLPWYLFAFWGGGGYPEMCWHCRMQQCVYLTHSLKTMVLHLDCTWTYLLYNENIKNKSEISEYVVLYTGTFVKPFFFLAFPFSYLMCYCLVLWMPGVQL